MKITEIAFGIEKQYRRKKSRIHLIPHHVSFGALCAGIVIGSVRPDLCVVGWICIFFSIALLFASLVLHLIVKKTSARYLVLWFVAWILLWTDFGILIAQQRSPAQMPVNTECRVQGYVREIQPGNAQIVARITHYQCGSEIHASSLNVRMRLEPNESRAEYGIVKGTVFMTSGTMISFEAPDVPGMFDSQTWADRKHLNGRLIRSRDAQITIVQRPDGPFAKLELARRYAYENLSAHSKTGLMPALVLGANRDIPPQIRERFGQLGIAHVLAVSGLHFGIVALVISFLMGRIASFSPWIMRRFGRRRFALAAAMPVLLIYMLFVGAPVSAQRALLMMTMCCIAFLINRKSERTRSLAVAGIIILIFDPTAVFSIGFQLSFAAILGVIWSMEFYESHVHIKLIEMDCSARAQRALAAGISACLITVGTALTTAPFVIAHFAMMPLTGIVSNLIVIPYVSFVLMPISIITAISLIAGFPCSPFLLSICEYTEKLLIGFADLYAEYIPFTYTDVSPHPIAVIASIGAAIAAFYRFRFVRWRIIATVAVVSVAIAVLAICSVFPRIFYQTDDLRISYIAMGQADGTLIEFPNGHIMVIDIGAEYGKSDNAGHDRMLPYLHSLGISHIDTLVVTHADYDHVAGIIPVLEHCSVGEVWVNDRHVESVPEWEKYILSHQIPIKPVATLPNQVEIGDVNIEILWPVPGGIETLRSLNLLSENEKSIVIALRYHRFSALYMGDAGVPAESQILAHHTLRPVTVLKAGHHGSKSASSEEWLNRTFPNVAVFSVGRNNRYHFPHNSVQKRFDNISSSMFRTDRHGTIRISTNGRGVWVETMRE